MEEFETEGQRRLIFFSYLKQAFDSKGNRKISRFDEC